MTSTKYIMSEGLAFNEKKDMEKLRRYAGQGWHVKRWAFMGYILEKGTPKNVMYTIDHRKLEDDKEEYLDLLAASGWEYIGSSGDAHLFCANADTQPIYSDDETKVEKYDALAKPVHSATIPVLAMTALSWLLTANFDSSILTFISLFLTIIAVPLLWTMLSAYSLKWDIEGKNGRVIAVKLLPLVVIAGAIAVLIATENNVFIVLAASIFGAATLPFAFIIAISLFYKLKKA